MFNLFHKNSKTDSNEILRTKKEIINDFISILEDFQNTMNSNVQWKKKKFVLDNQINLAKENYMRQIVDLNIKGE